MAGCPPQPRHSAAVDMHDRRTHAARAPLRSSYSSLGQLLPVAFPMVRQAAGERTSVLASVHVGGAPQFILAVAEPVVLVHAI